MPRKTFQVEYATRDMTFPQSIQAEVDIFYFDAAWWTDDDLARTLISVIENELGTGTEILLISWGTEPTEVASVTLEKL